MEPKKGYTVLTMMIYGWDLVWSSQETSDSPIMPDIFPSKALCRREIADIIQDQLQEWTWGERKENEIDSPSDYLIAGIEIDQQGNIRVYDSSDDTDIIVTTMDKWRADR